MLLVYYFMVKIITTILYRSGIIETFFEMNLSIYIVIQLVVCQSINLYHYYLIVNVIHSNN